MQSFDDVRRRYIRQKLQAELAQAAILGEDQRKLLKRIQSVTGQSVYQAKRVAQTERNRVQSQARWDAAQEAEKQGVSTYNEWRCRFVRSRDTHMARHGVRVRQGECFPGCNLRYPGDINGSAKEVINCHCYLQVGVLLPGEELDEDGKVREKASGLQSVGESGTMKGTEESEEKAAQIEQEFRYTDAHGKRSPIDRASFASMPVDAQEQAAAGIRKAKELFRLDTLPDRITFGSLRGAYGLYNETTRLLMLSKSRCKDPAEAYSTMIHELAHYYDHVSGHISEAVYKQALKALGLRANSRAAKNYVFQLILDNYSEEEKAAEVFAFSIEKASIGSKNALANKILEIIERE